MSTKQALQVARDVLGDHPLALRDACAEILRGSWRRSDTGELVEQGRGTRIADVLDRAARAHGVDYDPWMDEPLTPEEETAFASAESLGAKHDDAKRPDCACCEEFDANYGARAHIWRGGREPSGD